MSVYVSDFLGSSSIGVFAYFPLRVQNTCGNHSLKNRAGEIAKILVSPAPRSLELLICCTLVLKLRAAAHNVNAPQVGTNAREQICKMGELT